MTKLSLNYRSWTNGQQKSPFFQGIFDITYSKLATLSKLDTARLASPIFLHRDLTAFTGVPNSGVKSGLTRCDPQLTVILVGLIVRSANSVHGIQAVRGALTKGPPVRSCYTMGSPRAVGLLAWLCVKMNVLVAVTHSCICMR